MRLLVGWAFLVAIACGEPACGSPTGLLLIPTADVLPKGDLDIKPVLNFGTDPQSNNYFLDTQFGLLNRLEAGIDYEMSGNARSRLFGDAKYVFTTHKRSGLAAAIGTQVAMEYWPSSPYVVLTHRPARTGLHYGLMRIFGKQRWFGGVDYSLSDQWLLMADYTSGRANYWSFGFTYTLAKKTFLTLGGYFPNSEGDPYVTVQLDFITPLGFRPR